MMEHLQKQKQKGFFLIEVIVASAVITVVLVLLLGSIQNSVEASQRSLERTQASYLLEEGAEAIKSIRDTTWDDIAALTAGTPYYLLWSGTAWTLTTTPVSVGPFTRTLTMSGVSRDATDDITLSGGTDDTGTKKFRITLTWAVPAGTQTETLQFYISDIRN